MKTTLTVLFCFCVAVCCAQITFTRNDFGVNGDKVIYAVDSPATAGYNYGATGPAHTWQFNTRYAYPRRYDSTTFLNATTNPNAPHVTANLLARSIGTGDQYLEVTDSFVKTTFDFLQVNLAGVKLKTLNLPLTYLSQYTDSTTATAKGTFADFDLDPLPPFDSIRIQANIKLTSVCDGWGTLILPDTTSYNSLRVNQQISIEADVYFHSIIGWTYVTHRSQRNGNYSWYAADSKNFIANVQLDTSGNFSNFMYKIKKSPPPPKQVRLLSVSPDKITGGDTIDVMIKGFKTSFTAEVPYVYIPYCKILNKQVVDDTTLIVTITCPYSAQPGTYYIEVGNSIDGYFYLNNALTIIASPFAPKLVSVGPGFGAPGGNTTVTVNGSYTHFTKGVNIAFSPDSVSAGRIFVQSFQAQNDTTVVCDIFIENTAAYIPFTLYVSNFYDGNLSLKGAFIVTHTALDEELSASVYVYPNPATDQLNILLPHTAKANLIRLFDLNGKEIKQLISSETHTTLDVSNLDHSIYLLRITGDQLNLTKKIHVIH